MFIAAHNGARIWGGAERATVRLLSGLQQRGHRVLLLCNDSLVKAEADRAGIPTRRLRLGGDAAIADALPVDPLKWLGRLIMLKQPATLIGVINLKGPPDAEGRVEVGYEIEQDFRRKGYASEAVRALAAWCAGQPEVKAVQAKTLKQNEVSQAMLAKLGFKRLGPQRDPQLGEMIVWELTPSFPSG